MSPTPAPLPTLCVFLPLYVCVASMSLLLGVVFLCPFPASFPAIFPPLGVLCLPFSRLTLCLSLPLPLQTVVGVGFGCACMRACARVSLSRALAQSLSVVNPLSFR
jgi:hypothetical protein